MKNENSETKNNEVPTSYDEVPYGSHAFAQSHPERLATLGKLFGMSPTPVTGCRVLELGCSSGGNLLPMAYQLPGSEFVGVDLSKRQVEMGEKSIQDMGLKNIRIEHASILDVDDSWGKFDYIIAHGVYSWVPNEVQDKILAISADNLTPQGIAYVSYNTYPGWRMREMLRDMMLYHIRQIKDPERQVQQAKALLDFLATHVPTKDNAYGILLKNELALIKKTTDWYLFHDHLEEVNDPVYFYQFAERARQKGLQYLGESDFGSMLTSRLPKEAAETLRKVNKDIISTEQYMDFLRNRRFRQTLLCHQNVRLRRNIQPQSVRDLLVASLVVPEEGKVDLSPSKTQIFQTPKKQSIRTNRPLTKAALTVLRANWPRALDLETLFKKAVEQMQNEPSLRGKPVQGNPDVIAGDLLQGYTASVVEFHTWQGDYVIKAGEKPEASELARYQSRESTSVVNLRHEQLTLDPLGQRLLRVLDGTRDRAALVSHLSDLIKDGAMNIRQDDQPVTDPKQIQATLEQDVERRLAYLARVALLTA